VGAVEIVLGERWKDDVLHLGSLRSRRPFEATPRLSEYRDVFDLVIFGENWTADVEEEHIFTLLADLVVALEQLANGDSAKEIVEFPSSPYELTLVADGPQLQLTLMSIDRERDVLAFDVAVGAADFAHAVSKAGERLLADLLGLDDNYASDPFVRTFSASLASLARRRNIVFGRQAQTTRLEVAGASSLQDGQTDLTLHYQLNLTAGFNSFRGEPTFDWHSLLLPGQISVENQGGSVSVGGRFPVLTLVTLLRRVREVLNHEEAGRKTFSCHSRLPGLLFDIEAAEDMADVELGTEATLHFRTHIHSLVDVVLSLARLVLDDLQRQNPEIRKNIRFADIDAEARELQVWLADSRKENQYFERPEAFLSSHASVHPEVLEEEPPTFHWPLRDVRAVYPSQRWVWSKPGVHFSAISQADERLIVPAVDGLYALDEQKGEAIWSLHHLANTRLATYAVAGPYLAIANERGQRALVEITSGRVIGRAEGGSPILVAAAHYIENDLIVVVDYRGDAMGLNHEGQPAWATTSGQGTSTGVVFAGPLVSTLSSPGVLAAFDPLTGATLWNVRLGASGHSGPFSHEGRLYAFSHDELTQAIVLHAVHPFTGRAAWHLTLPGMPVSPPVFQESHMVAVIEHAGHVSMISIGLESNEVEWSVDLSSAGLDRPTTPLLVQIEERYHVVVRTDRAEMTCVDIESGEERWRYRSLPEDAILIRNLPILSVRDSILCASDQLMMHDVKTGEVLHSFADIFEVPEFLEASGALQVVVGESGDSGEPDSLTCLSIEHFLALVQS